MKKLWLHSVRSYLRLGMFFYFKRIYVHGLENVPKDKPVLLLANHQNALLDALLIATKCGRFSFFLTRAAVFKKALVSKLLKSLQMLPVYRVRDGWSNISNNIAIFESCSEILNNNEAIVIFPEGSHNLARRVRPLSKGFTRIVFDTLDKYPDLDLQLVPVGLNFVKATSFPDSAAIYFGSPISGSSFITENRNQDIVKLKSKIKEELSKLTTNIPEKNYDYILNKLDGLQVNYLKPDKVNTCIQSDFEKYDEKLKPSNNLLKRIFKYLLILNILIPYFLWSYVFKPRIKEPEFKSTFRFAIALTLVPLYLLIIAVTLSITISLSIGLSYLFIVLIISLITVKL
ncbi:1-acyl-sn-glycerol-3-phosphate acyltransferase [Pontimicrobium sp. SW4]|uniref:1-acyl-sn-glycerol-3-phosphate acyltransferase n=1 Tax=Pontimicrobium sp. SW4 TaxID=3153519 RepID=A0AAU7BV89_9FLAO